MLREDAPESVKDFEGTLCLGVLVLGVLETHLQEVGEPLVDGRHDLVLVKVVADDLALREALLEGIVVGALLIEDRSVGLGPPVDHLEPLQEEDAQVFGLVSCAAVNSGDDAFEDFVENMERVDLGHTQLNEHLQELYGVEGVCWREHEPWVEAVLGEEFADA